MKPLKTKQKSLRRLMRILNQSLNAGVVDEVVAAGTGFLNVVVMTKMTQMPTMLGKSLKSRETARVEIAMAVEIESDEGVDEITQGNEVAVVIGHHRVNARIQHKGSQTTARKPKLLKGVNAVIFQLGIPLFPMLLIRT